MKSALASTAFLMALGLTACAPLGLETDTQSSSASAANRPLVATDAGAGGQDPFYGKHTVRDILGHTSIAPGEDTTHGGSTTESLGVSPPGTSDGGA